MNINLQLSNVKKPSIKLALSGFVFNNGINFSPQNTKTFIMGLGV
jgi:hypothetical protein